MTPPDAQAGTAPTVATSANMDSHRALFVIGHLLPMGRFKQDASCGYADFPRKADHQSLGCPPRKTAAELQKVAVFCQCSGTCHATDEFGGFDRCASWQRCHESTAMNASQSRDVSHDHDSAGRWGDLVSSADFPVSSHICRDVRLTRDRSP